MVKKLSKFVPILSWLPAYQKSFFTGDLTAGITVGVMLIPQGMAYAMIAGLPPIYGLYAALIPIVMYAIFGTSRQLAVGPVALVSLLVATGVGAIEGLDPEGYILMAITLSFMVGITQFLMGAFRMGFLVNFLSHPVITGFTAAAALIIGLSQLKHLLGIEISRSSFIHEILIEAGRNISDVSIPTLLIGLLGIGIIMIIKRINRAFPGPLVVVVLGILVVYGLGLDEQGVKIVGVVPDGLPGFQLPSFNTDSWNVLLPSAFTIALVSFMESISVGKAIENRHRGEYEIDPNQELIALGMANMGGSFFQAYPVDGGFSRSAVNDQAGAKTGLSGLIAVVLITLTLLFLTPLFTFLPNAVLASIIMVAVFGLIDLKTARMLWKHDRKDFFMLMATFVATLVLGIIQGILIGMVLSLILVIYNSAYPHVAVLGRIPGTTFYRNVRRFQNAEIHEGILVLRFDAPLYFANAEFFRDQIKKLEKQAEGALELLILNAESIHSIDSSASRMLRQLIGELREKEIDVAVAGAIGPVRDVLHKNGMMEYIGQDHFFPQVHEAIDHLAGQKALQHSQHLATQVGVEKKKT